MREYLKGKYWKRRLALLLAVTMVLTLGAPGIDAASVYAAEAGVEGLGETVSPADGEKVSDGAAADAPAAGETGTATDVPDIGEAGESADIPNTGKTDDSADVSDAGGTDNSANVSDASGTDNSADVSDVGGTDNSADVSDAGETGGSTDASDAGEASEPAEVLESADTQDDANVPDMPEDENTPAGNYNAVAFESKEEFESIRQNMDLLWDVADGESQSLYDERCQSGVDTETLLTSNKEGNSYEYAYIQPINPNMADHTINIPANIKGIIIDRGYYENGEGEGYDFDIQVDTLNIKGADTLVYFGQWIGINAGEENKLSINFEAEESNISKVIFADNMVDAVIDCKSGRGTIAFGGSNIINGYTAAAATEFYAPEPPEGEEKSQNADLLIKEAGGLSFEEITGDVDVSIIFNGYPDDLELLPYFNKEINLGEADDEEAENGKRDRGISISFREYRKLPFWMDEMPEDWDWWNEIPTYEIEKGAQVAYFAGTTRNEKELIGCRVSYYDHRNDDNDETNDNDLWLNQSTGRLEQGEDEVERAAYAVLKLDSAAVFNEVKENTGLIFDNGNDYEGLWDETDALDEYLVKAGIEYVVIQATKTAQGLEDKTLELPGNIKGALLVQDWDNDEDIAIEWQLNLLKVKAGTEVYISGITIDTLEQDFNIELEDDASRVVFGGQCVVNAVVRCESKSGTIEFCGDTILNGYITKTKTEFSAPAPENEGDMPNAKLLIREAAGLSFEEIIGEVDVDFLFNGYPENPEYLPHFNKAIELGQVEDTDAGEDAGTGDGAGDEGTEGEGSGNKMRDRGITLRFWKYKENPFWFDETIEDGDWWEKTDAEDLASGTQVAYFAGTSRKEKERIRDKVSYYNHSKSDEENNLFIAYTGCLQEDGAEEERLAYQLLELADSDTFNSVKENTDLIFGEESEYNGLWDETDTLADYLANAGTGYVVIRAMAAANELEDKTLELPENIKGALLLSDWDDEAQERIEWLLKVISAEGGKEIYILDTNINPLIDESVDPESQKFEIITTSPDVSVVFAHSEIMGDTKISGVANVKFTDAAISGALDLGSEKTTSVALEGLFLADNLSGYSALEIIGGTTFIVRYHGEVVIENCHFTKADGSDEEPNLSLVYNGYPEDASLLPVFNDNIAFPENGGITFRFAKQTEDEFWNGEEWWDNIQDELLPIGSQIATVGVDGDKFDSLMERLGYWSSNEENQENVELVRSEDGALCIQKTNPETGNKVVGFILAADKTKIYDGAAFAISEENISNNCGYTGSVDITWFYKNGTGLTELTEAPKDAGEYVLKMSVPADTDGFEGETQADIVITPKTVTISIKANENKYEGYEIIWTGLIEGDVYTKTEAEAVVGEEITENGEKYHMVSTEGGDAGSNYIIKHADPVKIPVKEEVKPIINSVLFPKNKESYSAVYTGEQIRPAMVVTYKYTDGSRQKTQKLKLNVDYILTYTNNVNVTNTDHMAKVTIRGIGEYSGEITKEFSITPKSIKKVTLSAVGDIIFGSDPVVTVMDGTYELVKDIDYKIVDGNGNEVDWSKQGSETNDTQTVLKVKGIGNYNEISNKKAKFNILKSTAADSADIKSIAAESVTVEFKKLPARGYTYNGKAVKPAVVVKDGGVKVPASKYKVIYTNNVNAGTQTATVKVVGITKKGKGYYGVSKELKFDIKQKDFAKVKVSSIAAVPKTKDFVGATMTVKDGKRILTEGEDYTVDYSSILNTDGSLKNDIVIGQKYDVVLSPVENGNYLKDSKKTVKIKFGQLNLASKTANISVKIKDAANSKVEVMYNGVLLTEKIDYTVKLKPNKKKNDKNETTYTVTVTAVKKSAYKGKKVVKNLAEETGTGQ